MKRIDTITLDNVLPRVFEADEPRPSELWRTRLTFERGKVYGINAASGTGKTSLCSFLTGIRHDYSGRILFDDTDVARWGVGRWCDVRRRHLAYVPQELDIFDELTALENVLLKNRLTGYATEADIRAMFEELGVDHRIDTPAGRMSVGQKQRVAIIRALCQPFDFIVLDEPVSHLDPYNNELCGRMVAREAARQSAGVIFTSVGASLQTGTPMIPLHL